jgi:flagellar biosynthesis protein FlhB
MAEEAAQERTETPTQKRLVKAHDEGQVPKSTELSAAVVVLGGAFALAYFGGSSIGKGMEEFLRDSTRQLVAAPLTQLDAIAILRNLTRVTVVALGPFFLAVAIPAIFVNAMQARGVLSLAPITPQFSRINPGAGLKRLLSGQSVFTLLKSIAKVIIIGCVGWLAMSAAWPGIMALSGADTSLVIPAVRDTTLRLVLFCGMAFLGLSLVDYGYASWQHQQKMRMTRQEVVQEFRETEGDPHRKAKMKTIASALVRKRMMHRVKEADVIIVNPTSIAVAIRYDGISPAPIVLAMGRRKLAERILVLARAANVPVVQNIPVARALIATAIVGRPIPPALYTAVAEVLAFVYRQRGHLPRALVDRSVA